MLLRVQGVARHLGVFSLLVNGHWAVLSSADTLLCQVAHRARVAVLAYAPTLEALVLPASPEKVGAIHIALEVATAHRAPSSQ